MIRSTARTTSSTSAAHPVTLVRIAQRVGIQSERGDRGAQAMGEVGHQLALGGQQLHDALGQPVEGVTRPPRSPVDPAGSTRASRSPAPSRSAVRASSATGRTTPRATRSATRTTTTSSTRLSPASRAQADATPWVQGVLGHEHRDDVDGSVGHDHWHQHPLTTPHPDGRGSSAGLLHGARRPARVDRAPARERRSPTPAPRCPRSAPSMTRPASEGATDRTGSRAWADRWAATMARSWATRWIRSPSGMAKARMMVKVMAAAPITSRARTLRPRGRPA